MNTITQSEAVNMINNMQGNKIYNVNFIKKDGSLRSLTCINKCIKHLRGGESTTKHLNHLITVFDMQNQGYRNINVNTIQSLNCNGEQYVVQQ